MKVSRSAFMDGVGASKAHRLVIIASFSAALCSAFHAVGPRFAHTRQSLLQNAADAAEGSGMANEAALKVQSAQHAKLEPPGFFESFDMGESTYNEDADHGREVEKGSLADYEDGWNPSLKDPFAPRKVASAWFHDSPSGGRDSAWQTHYPDSTVGLAGHANENLPAWHRSLGGAWHQNFKAMDPDGRSALSDGDAAIEDEASGQSIEALPAGWFDSQVLQMDSFGRHKFPDYGTAQQLVGLGWKEQAVNTTMACNAPGCTASTVLQAFDNTKQQATHCRLNVDFKATDFDDFETGKWVDYISVNGVNVSVRCKPKAQGCNATLAGPLYPCVTELDIATVLPASGTLKIEAKISEFVDECPFQGNYLYAIPTVSCLVKAFENNSLFLPGKINQPGLATVNKTNTTLIAVQPVQCTHRNCIARARIELERAEAMITGCTFTFKVNVTDYDNTPFTSTPKEVIEYVKVDGVTLASAVNPNVNPCVAASQGKPVSAAEKVFTVVSSKNISVNSSTDFFEVEAKISPFVDECPSQGFLLDGLAEVICQLDPATMQEIESDAQVKPAVLSAGPALEPPGPAQSIIAAGANKSSN